jgi:hypothetical protein
MNATRRYRSDRHTWRLVELALVGAFMLTVMLAVVGGFTAEARGHFSCATRSIASVSDTCSPR